MRKVALVVATILLLSIVAFAKGGSSGGSAVSLPDSPNDVKPEKTPDCEVFKQTKNRIKCRLTYGNPSETVPEPCRVIEKNANCIKYYKEVLPCYEIKGTKKDKCFKDLAKFTKKSIKMQAKESNNWPLKYYMLFVLYDLEEVIEDAQDEGIIELNTAAEIIDDIVAIKIKILKNGAKKEIHTDLENLQSKWPKVVDL